MEYRHLIADPATREVWEKSSAKIIGRLMKCLKRGIQGTETMIFIQKHEVPYDKKVTYAKFICELAIQAITMSELTKKRKTEPWEGLPFIR